MKPWMWIVIAVLVVALIAYMVYASNKAKQAALLQAQYNAQLNGLGGTQVPPSSKLAQIIASLVPFLSLFNNNNNNNSGPGGANNEPGTPLGDYCEQYPDSVLCRG